MIAHQKWGASYVVNGFVRSFDSPCALRSPWFVVSALALSIASHSTRSNPPDSTARTADRADGRPGVRGESN